MMEAQPSEAGEPCDVLEEPVPYVQGWMEAAGVVAVLRAELAACGLDERLPGVRAEVTVAGVGVVELGRITLETARRLAALLALARQVDPPPGDSAAA